MDGVLVDNREAHSEAFVIFCERYGVEMSQERLLAMYGMGNDDIMPALLPREIIERVGLEALADEKEAIYREVYADAIVPTPGLIEFIDDLRRHGVRLAVGSSGMRANVDFVLEKLGVAAQFDAVVHGDMVTRRKPDPEIFLTCSQLMGTPPEECLVCEDSFSGIEAARSAGMKVVALATSFTHEELAATDNDLIIKDFRELSCDRIATIPLP
jgi:HAD superfamily hydrolase (TIGR01509 family)